MRSRRGNVFETGRGGHIHGDIDVQAGLRQARLQDGRRLLERLFNDPTLPLPDDANHRAGNAPAPAGETPIFSVAWQVFYDISVRRSTASSNDGLPAKKIGRKNSGGASNNSPPIRLTPAYTRTNFPADCQNSGAFPSPTTCA